MASVILTGIFYYLISEFIPVHEGQPKPSILKIYFTPAYLILPFYIMPWFKLDHGHENDFEENMDGDPKSKIIFRLS